SSTNSSLASAPHPHFHPPSLHDALPIYRRGEADHAEAVVLVELVEAVFERLAGLLHLRAAHAAGGVHDQDHVLRDAALRWSRPRSEEHTSELQSRVEIVWRLLREKQNGM